MGFLENMEIKRCGREWCYRGTCWICLLRCLEMGVRMILSAEPFSALHSPQ